MTVIESSLKLDNDIVAEYLSNNKNFFSQNPELLHFLELPHESGTATSLVERQVAILRERNIDTRKRLTALLEAAATNDRLFQKTRKLSLALMDASTPAELDDVLAENLIADFEADHAVVYLLGSHIPEQPHILNLSTEDSAPIAGLFSHTGPSCGTYRSAEYAQLFNDHSFRAPGSAALVPMQCQDLNAALAIGSADPNRFSREMGTIFLEFIGEVLNRTLLRFA
jgi:uncharacterized protein YigA (DUF484 family)